MPDLKTLKVCLSSELPLITERDPNTIYFLYDKLLVFLGQSLYNDPYAIVEAIPENPVFNMLYFDLSDGKVKAYIDYSITEIAEVETPEQLEILKQSGTTFFVNSEKRYLDLRRRTVTLPYQNGTYMLTVDLANNLKFDENTVLGFNPETNCFEVIGKYDDFDMVFTRRYRDLDTHTVDTIPETAGKYNLKKMPADNRKKAPPLIGTAPPDAPYTGRSPRTWDRPPPWASPAAGKRAFSRWRPGRCRCRPPRPERRSPPPSPRRSGYTFACYFLLFMPNC